MLIEIKPESWHPYAKNYPKVVGGVLILSSLNPSSLPTFIHGMALTELPAYSAGVVLQWAIRGLTTTPPAVLNISVQSGAGDENTLSVKNLAIPPKLSWVKTKPVMVDVFKPFVYLWTPELGKEFKIRNFALGDQKSIDSFISAETAKDWLPMEPANGPPLPRLLNIYWPW